MGDEARERWAILLVWVLAALAVFLVVLRALNFTIVWPF